MIEHMRGLPLIQPDNDGSEAARLLAATQVTFGLTPNMAKAMANSPAALDGYLNLYRVLREGSLPVTLCERIALLVAQENECDYCLSAHTYIGTKVAGLSEREAARARVGQADEPEDDAALALAAVLVRNRGTVTDEQLSAARGAGLTDEQIVETIAHVALNVFTNYLNKAARVDIDWPLVRHTDGTAHQMETGI